LYTETVIEHYKNPQNIGEIDDADGIGEAGEMKCGDFMKLFIKVKDNHICDIKFQVYGCGAAIASSSMTTVLAKGKHILAAYAITNKMISEALGGLPPEKEHCSLLGERALKSAILNHSQKTKISQMKNETFQK